MQDTSTTTKSQKTFPTIKVEKKPRVQNNLESQMEEPLGYFSPDKPRTTGFSAYGSMNLTNNESYQIAVAEPNLDKKVPDSAVSSIFNGGFVTLEKTATGLGALTNVLLNAAKDTVGAVTDVVKENVTFETPKEQTEASIKQAEETEKKTVEAQFITQAQQDIEDTLSSIQRFLANKAQTAPLRQEISQLTGLPEWLGDIVTEKNEVRTDLVAAMALTRKDILAKQSSRAQGIFSSSKRGGQGIDLNANKAGETSGGNSNAQNAVG